MWFMRLFLILHRPCGLVANVLDCDIIVSEFEIQFTFRLISLRKAWTFVSRQLWIK